MRTYLVSNITLSVDASFQEAFSVSRAKLRHLGIADSALEYKIFRKSVDARKKNDIKIVYSVAVSGDLPSLEEMKKKGRDITELSYSRPERGNGTEELTDDIFIVGTGPAGLFAGLFLAEAGYKPVLIERGGDISTRKAAFERFLRTRVLDPETNVQFGAGGAGTFSDGKLVTRINDPYCTYVLERLREFGAPEDILTSAKPHVGTDVLSVVVENILRRITELGGRVLYNTRLTDLTVFSGRTVSIETTRGAFSVGALILAIGHSARDTYYKLLEKGFLIEPKQFSVGMRIEHLTSTIDEGLYGSFAGHPALGHGEYALSYNTKSRGAYTFCMCPGGVVVPAASEKGGVVVNGMSYRSRDGKNSNSAVVSTVFKEDYGNTAEKAIEFQRSIERRAFISAGEDYSAPMITVRDFLSGGLSSEPCSVEPSYMNGGVRLVRPEEYLPAFVTENIKGAITDFGRKIPGFSMGDAILTGPETRTSSPVRILRSKDSYLARGTSNLYPIGEGAGYAGGITSAAVDGLKCAVMITKRFKPKD